MELNLGISTKKNIMDDETMRTIIETKSAMSLPNKEIFDKLFQIYKKHIQMYKSNPHSKQMCCMWSTSDPPNIVFETDPFFDIEDAFGISISEDECIELYDMSIKDAALKIETIIEQNC